MQITRQADYALRAMLYLASLEPTERAATRQIAEVKNIPSSFLAKIISQLSIAGLIHTSRGARGGVSLALPADRISILEVVEAIDGPLSLNECTLNPASCTESEDCPLHVIWCESQADLMTRLRTTTFAQMLASQAG